MNDADLIVRSHLRQLKKASWILSIVPFMRAVILNGSLAAGTAKASSDIDFLIITSPGRIYTVRWLALSLLWLAGLKRSRDEAKPHGGKICCNYFMTTNSLRIPTGRGKAMDQYCAENYSKSVLVYGDERIYQKFFKTNHHLFSLCHPDQRGGIFCGHPNGRFLDEVYPEPVEWARNDSHESVCDNLPIGSNYLRSFGWMQELILGGSLGDQIEKILRFWQRRRVEREGLQKRYPDLIVLSDNELRFHPPKS